MKMMPSPSPLQTVDVMIDGQAVHVRRGASVAAALATLAAPGVARRSVGGELRAPLCGMGVCHECRVLIDGWRRLACQTVCQNGMRVETGTRVPEASA